MRAVYAHFPINCAITEGKKKPERIIFFIHLFFREIKICLFLKFKVALLSKYETFWAKNTPDA